MATAREKVSDAAVNVKPYVERAMKDEELRKSVKSAFAAAKELYVELADGKGGVTHAASKIAKDKDMQESLRKAVEELRSASKRLKGEERSGSGKAGAMLLIGIVLGVLFNPATGPATRGWLRRKLFGGGSGSSEFTYGSNSN